MLEERFPKEGASAALIRALDVSYGTIYKRARQLGLKSVAREPWTLEQDQILQIHYPTEGITPALEKMVGRKRASICHRIVRLGLELKVPYIHPNFTGCGEVSGLYVGSVKNSAKHRGLPFVLTACDIRDLWLAQDKRCVYSGRLISFRDKTASVDRIDSTRGYVLDNIQIVHVDVNKMKMSRTHEEFLELIRLINSHQNYAQRQT